MPDVLTKQDRARGTLLGGAIGDALGAVVEFVRDASELQAILGSAPPSKLPAPLVTDDTQMTLFTAEAIIRTWVRRALKGIASLDGVTHNGYLRWLRTQQRSVADVRPNDGWLLPHAQLWTRRAPGNTCLSALESGNAGSVEDRINNSMGCGGVMRTAPIGLAYPPQRAFELGCSNAALTHGHDNGIATAGLLAELIALLYNGSGLSDAISAVIGHADHAPIAADTAALLHKAEALAGGTFDRDDLTRELGEGWVGHEALAIAVACVIAHSDDPARAIWVAADHCGDSDSTASIAGQILGAAYGVSALPAQWVAEVELGGVAIELADVLSAIADGSADPDALWNRFPGV
jgi:ADP-ribosylglycohydrolase